MPAPMRSAFSPAQVFAVKAAIVLAGLRRPGGEEIAAGVAERALQREPDAHPAVVVEVGVRDPRQRLADRRQRSRLRMRRADVAGSRPRRAAPASGGPAPAPAPRRGTRAPPPRRPPGDRRCRDRRGSPPATRRAGRCRDGWHARRTAGRARAPRSARGGCRRTARPRDRPAAASAPGRSAAPACRRAARAAEPLELERQLGIRDVDVDRDDRPADDADAGVRPGPPDVELVLGGRALGVPGPVGIVRPGAVAEAPGLLRARHDRQDRIAVGDEPRAEALHEALLGHQNGILSAMPSSRSRSWPASSRRVSQ